MPMGDGPLEPHLTSPGTGERRRLRGVKGEWEIFGDDGHVGRDV